MRRKISIIGAGSAVFSLTLIRDLCLTPSLGGSTVCLMDIDPVRLETAMALCRRYATEVGAELQVEGTTERQAALEGADFVVNAALAAGHDRLRAGWQIARGLGYRFGGSYHVLHDEAFWINFYQFRLFETLLQDMLILCPRAWYIQVANPVLAGITYLARRYPQIKMVGLCHGFAGVYHLAEALGLDRNHLSFEVCGVNHFIWLTYLAWQSENALPRLERWIQETAPRYWATCSPSSDLGPKAVDLYRRFGVFPIGDTCTPGGGSWPWWYHVDAATEQRWREDPAAWWERYFLENARKVEEARRVAAATTSRVTAAYPPRLSGETIVPLIEALACDRPQVFIVNIQNTGEFVPGVPRDFAVEVPALVSGRGIQGIRTRGLPEPVLAYLLRDRVGPITVELEAYLQGDRRRLLDLVLMDPWTRTEEQARRLVEAILALPFHEEMRDHYR